MRDAPGLKDGPTAGAEWRSTGRRAGSVVIVGCRSRDGGFDGFKAACRAAGGRFDDKALALTATVAGKALAFDGVGPLRVDGIARPFTEMGPVPMVTRVMGPTESEGDDRTAAE